MKDRNDPDLDKDTTIGYWVVIIGIALIFATFGGLGLWFHFFPAHPRETGGQVVIRRLDVPPTTTEPTYNELKAENARLTKELAACQKGATHGGQSDQGGTAVSRSSGATNRDEPIRPGSRAEPTLLDRPVVTRDGGIVTGDSGRTAATAEVQGVANVQRSEKPIQVQTSSVQIAGRRLDEVLPVRSIAADRPVAPGTIVHHSAYELARAGLPADYLPGMSTHRGWSPPSSVTTAPKSNTMVSAAIRQPSNPPEPYHPLCDPLSTARATDLRVYPGYFWLRCDVLQSWIVEGAPDIVPWLAFHNYPTITAVTVSIPYSQYRGTHVVEACWHGIDPNGSVLAGAAGWCAKRQVDAGMREPINIETQPAPGEEPVVIGR